MQFSVILILLQPQKCELLRQSAAEVAREAEQQLPPEPGVGDAGGCSVAVRFPDGQRRQRRFPRAAPLEAVRAFCLVHSPDAAAGRPFALSESMPGESSLTRSLVFLPLLEKN